ncbi:MAG: hypothetical protein P9L99_13755 [Candidatus Lernaella stagnicola]|nr:hypothetical protein [Candidatus Lernaella stagnicola]
MARKLFSLCVWVLPLVCVILAVATCDGRTTLESTRAGDADALVTQADPQSPSGLVDVSTPFDVAEIIQQVHFAFRPAGDYFDGGHETYQVRVARDASFAVTPFLPSPEGGVAGPPLVLRSDAVLRGDLRLDAEPQLTVDEDGSLAIARGSLTEWLENTPEGVQQSWTFETMPAGTGDLRVRVAVEGLPYTETTAGGVHFADPETELGIRYTHARWIDAADRTVEVPARYADGFIEMTVPAGILAESIYPADLDPWAGPEIGTDNPIYMPARNRQAFVDIAFGETAYMIVWEDRRVSEGNTISDVYATRVNSNGSLLTPGGIVVSRAAGNQGNPAVAFDNGEYLVVWEDNRGGGVDIYGARLSQAGSVLDPDGFAIGNAAGDQGNPHVAASDNQWLVVWNDGRSAAKDVYGTRVDPDGNVLDGVGTGISVGSAAGEFAKPVVAWDDYHYLVVWTTLEADYNLYAQGVNTDGGLAGSTVIVTNGPGDQRAPAVSFGATLFLVSWLYNSGSDADIHGCLIDRTGVIAVPNFIICDESGDQESSHSAFDGTNFLVVWDDLRGSAYDIYGSRVTEAGAVLDPAGLALSSASGNQYEPVAAFGISDYLVAWHDYRASGLPDVYATRVSTSGSVVNPNGIVLSVAANFQTWSDVAFDGTNYLIVWEDQRDGTNWDIYGVRLTSDGSLLDPAGIEVSNAVNKQEKPTVAFGGGNFFVAWSDYRSGTFWDIYGTRVSQAGVVLDGVSTGTAVSTAADNQLDPDAAYANDYFLVAWRDNRNGDYDIYGARVNNAGTMVDPSGIAIAVFDGAQGYPSVTASNTQYLVVWEDPRNGTFDIYSTRLQTDGGVNSPSGIIVSNAAGDQLRPEVDSDGTNFFAVWEDNRFPQSAIYGSRINSVGGTVDPGGIQVNIGTAARSKPAIVYDGQYFLVAWQQETSVGGSNIYGSYLRSTGSIIEPLFDISATDYLDESSPNLASSGGGTSLVTYFNFDRSTFYGSKRVFARQVRYFFTGLECEFDGECQTGFCVDGYCCNTVCGEDDPNDCLACSIDAGSTANGTCAVVSVGTTCRPQNGLCDIVEQCDGVSDQCPDDSYAAASLECRPAADLCDSSESCNGAGPFCPNDAVEPDTILCRPTAGDCDVDEYCNGEDSFCPRDGFLPAVTECRPAESDCDIVEFCPGDAADCPVDELHPNGTVCEDGLFCNGEDACVAGDCAGHAGDPCDEDEVCVELTDECVQGDDDDDDTVDDDDDNDDDDTTDDDDDDTTDDDDDESPPADSGDDDDDDSCCGC